MAAKKPQASQPPPEPTPSLYPALEQFAETATAADVQALFAPLRSGLKGLKGARAEQAKKVDQAIVRTEELLGRLLQVRESIEKERKAAPSKRR